jgi:hypothetical protein
MNKFKVGSIFQNDFKKKRESLEPIFTRLGLNYDEWSALRSLSFFINQFKHPQQFNLEDAYQQIESLFDTDGEQYAAPFKKLIELFRSKNFDYNLFY